VRRAVIALLALPLTGCFADQKQHTAACEIEALHTYPADHYNQIDNYIIKCMAAYGYDKAFFQSKCPNTPMLVREPTCYAPMGRLGRLIYQFETGSELKPEPSN